MSLIDYVSIDMANQYFEKRLYTEKWDNAEDIDRQKALSMASYLISGMFSFYDEACVDNVWNPRIVGAVCEEALFLLKKDPTETPELLWLGISQSSAGSVSASFDKSFVAPLVCDSAKGLIGDLGVLIDTNSENRLRMTNIAL